MTAPLSPARLEVIRAAIEFTSKGEPAPVYRDRADLLAHVDWLNELLARAEAALAAAPDAVAPEIRGLFPVVCYFGNEVDRDEFSALIQEAKPGMVARNV